MAGDAYASCCQMSKEVFMQDILESLKSIREKSKHTVDKSTLKNLDEVIQAVEAEISVKSDTATVLRLISWAARIIAVIRFLTGDTPSH